MAKMSKKREDYLTRCRKRIQMAKNFRQREGLDDLWERLVDLYRGKQWEKDDLTNEDRMVVNVCFATINVIGPSVAINHPKVVTHARRPEDSERAIILEQVINYWWQHYDVMPEFQLSVKDSLILGFGWLKVGYRYTEEEFEDTEAYEREVQERIAEAASYAAENPELAGAVATDDEIRESIPVSTRTVVTEDRPFVERVAPRDVYVDPDATSMRDAKWIAQKITKTLEEVRDDQRYKGSARRSVKPNGRVPDDVTAWPETKEISADDQHVSVWEYYDLQHGQMCVFAENGEDFLVDPIDQPYAFGQPFVMIRNYDVPDQFYPMGELEALEPLQHELNLTRTAMFNDRKQFRRRWLYDPSAFNKQGQELLTSPKDNLAIPVQGTRPLNEVIIPFPGQTPNPQLYQDSQIIEKDLVDVSGINEYMRGAIPETRRTATEAAIIQDAANSRAADKLSRVEWAVRVVARRMVQLAQQYMDAPQVARIVGVNGFDHWFEFEADDIKGEFDFEVEAGSTQPKNELQRRKQALELLQTLAPFADPALGLIDIRQLILHVLRFGFEIANPERFMAPAPIPGMGDPAMLAQMMGGGTPPAMGQGMPAPGQPPAEGAESLVQGVPQELAQQLAGQMGGGGIG